MSVGFPQDPYTGSVRFHRIPVHSLAKTHNAIISCQTLFSACAAEPWLPASFGPTMLGYQRQWQGPQRSEAVTVSACPGLTAARPSYAYELHYSSSIAVSQVTNTARGPTQQAPYRCACTGTPGLGGTRTCLPAVQYLLCVLAPARAVCNPVNGWLQWARLCQELSAQAHSDTGTHPTFPTATRTLTHGCLRRTHANIHKRRLLSWTGQSPSSAVRRPSRRRTTTSSPRTGGCSVCVGPDA